MRKEILQYKAAMAIFQTWADKGILTADDLVLIRGVLAEKYGLSLDSIYRRKPLL